MAGEKRGLHILKRSELRIDAGDLEGAGDAVFADGMRRQAPDGTPAIANIPAIHSQLAGQEVE